MSWKVVYSGQARQDLRDIYEYISYHLLEPETAKKQVRRIRDEICALDHMPLRYRVFDEEPWRGQGVRFFPVNNYLVFYWPDETALTVTIVRIMYGGRDVSRQLMESW